ncbi:MarR family transcriptional regulator [Arthrobacter sp. NPDC093128]|uniref:MarR family winged helix-turn-helix transcriptional regulator n=1 Tax=Arthrobacter sp. NPDC093128 TaxID=3154979 RepID=UPI00342135A7
MKTSSTDPATEAKPEVGPAEVPGQAEVPDVSHRDFLSFSDVAIKVTQRRLPSVDPGAMEMVLLLHRVTNALVYDLESTVHRPAGWSWGAFRLLFTVWVSGSLESKKAAKLAGMSRAAVSSLTNTLEASGLMARTPDPTDRRGVLLKLTPAGKQSFEKAFLHHNAREREWASPFTPDELQTFIYLLEKLNTAGQQAWVSHRD